MALELTLSFGAAFRGVRTEMKADVLQLNSLFSQQSVSLPVSELPRNE